MPGSRPWVTFVTLLLAAPILGACVGGTTTPTETQVAAVMVSTAPIQLQGGALELNPRLHGALSVVSEADPLPGVISSGTCPSGETGDCGYLGHLYPDPYLRGFNRLPRSEYLWVDSDTRLRLSYEWVFRGIQVRNNDGELQYPQPINLGTCLPGTPPRGTWHDAATRAELRDIHGRRALLPWSHMETIFRFRQVTCRRPATSVAPGVDPAPVTTGCIMRGVNDVFKPARLSMENPPFCVMHYPLFDAGMFDISQRLFAEPVPERFDPAWANADLRQETVLPHLFTVRAGGTRHYMRRLTLKESRPLDAERGEDYDFEYRVPLTADGARWLENFSPTLLVDGVRVLRVRGNVPLPIQRLTVDTINCRSHNEDRTRYAIKNCGAGYYSTTPAYTQDVLDLAERHRRRVGDQERARWDIRVRVPPGSDLLRPDDEALIEFELRSVSLTETTAQGLQPLTRLDIRPARRHLGFLPPVEDLPGMQAFELENRGASELRVEGIAVVGLDASQFHVGSIVHNKLQGDLIIPQRDVPTPFTLQPSETASVEIQPRLQGEGDRHGLFTVVYRDRRNTVSVATSELLARAGASLSAQPRVRTFILNQPALVPRISATVLLTNDGQLPFERRSYSVSGPDSDLFRLVRAGMESEGWFAPDVPRSIAPGGFEILWIEYMPRAQGRHEAVLHVDTSAGRDEVELIGSCYDGCRPPVMLEPVRPVDPETRELRLME
ncbi:hypothetical protein B1C78_05025 [Thioalkalivibrio denitrificans]|uniref:Lipoprotein n=1 Tax=Thioalkalivibrio denitrificans TaxID=108003 RepID=A0A1V3NMU8_9GAMM|nr:hypothetical protein B1C78_05025 [Thioalkalivibrio denitrificans]